MNYIKMIQSLTPPFLQRSVRRVMGGCETTSSPIIVTDPSIGSFSQYHEDLIIDAILGCSQEGFYIDVGANHPQLLNNTKRFYDKGWRGVNIEPNPTLFNLLQQERINDINLNVGLGKEKGEMYFYLLDPDSLSTFNLKTAESAIESLGARLVSRLLIDVNTLKDVLESYISEQSIDFMSIDVEGYEEEVIAGGDWHKFRPKLLLMEINQRGKELIDSMQQKDYRLIYSNGTNGIFIDDKANVIK